MKFLSKLYNWVTNLIFYPFLVLLIAVLILFVCGIRPYITMSGSMEPAIRTGSVCFVNITADYKDIEKGDVIAYEMSGGSLVTHRVISITEDGMETKGDANDVSDGISTTERNFCGKTLFSIPYLGYAIKYLQQPAIIAIVLIIAAGIVALSVVSYWEAKKEGEPK